MTIVQKLIDISFEIGLEYLSIDKPLRRNRTHVHIHHIPQTRKPLLNNQRKFPIYPMDEYHLHV